MQALVEILSDLKADNIGFIGDKRSQAFRAGLVAEMPKAKVSDQHGILDRMQRNRTVNEIAQFRTAAQLISIATQAAYHVARAGVTDYEMYAAFTMAQMARGGETGDGYQIGANQWGTHCGKPYGHIIRKGDIGNLYVSNVTYQGYTAQTARMFAFGELTGRQELVLDACTRGVKAADWPISWSKRPRRPGRMRSSFRPFPPPRSPGPRPPRPTIRRPRPAKATSSTC